MNRFNTDVDDNDRSHPKVLKMFDWLKAAKIIKENNIQNASIGLGVTLDNAIPILQNGKPIKITGGVFLSSDHSPVLINNDNGEIMNCFFSINDQDLEYSTIYSPSSIEVTKESGWPKAAINIIKENFYYKSGQKNKLLQVYLTSPLLCFANLLECGGCIGL
ncbi:hypothetical protein [Candidatus Nitrosocosmicus franklandus]|uniref:hypothetical protein n=1 Tax=Candidatus Nitrosocosmicus franklandianus TaxID=1798806 RepID=UPI00106D75F6|nr:hypothetical protein [Candidatus Nitrosocosmicus franklandus]